MYKRYIVNTLIKQAGILGNIGSLAGSGGSTLSSAGDSIQSGAEDLGYTIGELITRPDSDNDDLGPYKDVVKHIKDTEIAEAYLREAAKLRRKARIIKRHREEDEGMRNAIARSRFF